MEPVVQNYSENTGLHVNEKEVLENAIRKEFIIGKDKLLLEYLSLFWK